MYSKSTSICCLALQVLLAVTVLARCSAGNFTSNRSKEYHVTIPDANVTQLVNFYRSKREVNIEFNANDFVDKVETWVKNSDPGERRGFVKGLLEQAKFVAPSGYHVMICNLNQEYANGLRGVIAHTNTQRYGATFGIWMFKCGTFMNKGERGWENWAFTERGGEFDKVFAKGAGVIFMHPDCDHPAYRPFNHHIVWNKDYPGSDIRVFHDVETREECMAWTIEIDGNVAVYVYEERKCCVKRIHYNRGNTYDTWGNRLGDYDVDAFDVEEANGTRKNELIKEGKCDVIHSNIPPDDRHYCKVFKPCDYCTLMFRKRPNPQRPR